MSDLPYGDHPIQTEDEDVLGRGPLARALADELVSLNAERGAVAAILGPWGSGKTSLMNLVERHLETYSDVRLVEFNPWLFSGTEQLAALFLAELANQLREEETRGASARRIGANITESIAAYSKLLSGLSLIPGFGTVKGAFDETLGAAEKVLRGDQSLSVERAKVLDLLSNIEGRIIVLVDDIDRLNRDEIRQLFRTVRLTASFPNVVYLLCLDRYVVEQALEDGALSGRAYLEKILTITCTIPAPPIGSLRRAFLESVEKILANHPAGPLDEGTFHRVLRELVDPLTSSMRDTKRILASLPITLRVVGNEVALADVIGLETVRLLAPELHDLLDKSSAGLTTVADSIFVNTAAVKDQIERFIAADARGGWVARAVISTLFPAALRHIDGPAFPYGEERLWKYHRRVASADILQLYLTRQVAPSAATASQIASIIERFANRLEPREQFAALPDDVLEDALESIEAYSEEAPGNVAPMAVTVLLEQFPRLRTERRGMLDFGSEFLITRPVLRFLQKLPPSGVFEICVPLIRETPTLFGAFELVTIVGHRPNAGHQLVSEADAMRLEEQLRERLLATPVDALARERELLRILYHVLQPPEAANDLATPALSDPRLIGALLRAGVTTSYRSGGATTNIEHGFNAEIVVRLVGGTANLASTLESLDLAIAAGDIVPDEKMGMGIDYARRYLDGWRPPASPFEEDDD